MKTFSDAEVVLAAALPGYESRAPQQRLAQMVEAVFSNEDNFPDADADEEDLPAPRHLFAQAGTGTGKSLGYLIPTLLSGRRVIVSVTTKALQDQLSSKDLPFLEEHLGVDFSWTVLKGRTNYLCLNKAMAADESEVPGLADILTMAQKSDFDGLRDSLGFDLTPAQWFKICAESEECLANNCTKIGGCFAEDARTRARACDVVIVNHALFFTDLQVKQYGMGGMLDAYDLVVFDEAHEIEEIASNSMSNQFSEGSIRGLTAEVRNLARRYTEDGEDPFSEVISELLSSTSTLFQVLEPGRLRYGHVNNLATEFGAVIDNLQVLKTMVANVDVSRSADLKKARSNKDRVSRRACSMVVRFHNLITASWDELVRWVEIETNPATRETRKVIKSAPIDVSSILREQLFSRTPTVLCSATMTVGGAFAHMSSRLGVDDFDGLDVGTPFDYTTQARLYVPSHLPEPKGQNTAAWEAQATEEIIDLIKASEGRTLVLFTNNKHMRATLDAVKRRVAYPVRMQGEPGSTVKGLASWFAETNEGVLFGSKSFFTGMDFQGDTCTTVIIAKLPFPVPNEPMTEARCEAITRAGGNSFSDYSVPVMTLVLQQAVGRLIRRSSDKGVVAILDPRLVTKGYGTSIRRDLPPMPLVKSLAEVQGFLDSIKERVPA